MDPKIGYWQVKVAKEDKEETAFTVPHWELFVFYCMPFGLTNTPAVFHSLMPIVLQGLNNFTVAYFDDILIFFFMKETPIDHINQVFVRLRQHRLRIKQRSALKQNPCITYQGFIISDIGMSPDPVRVSF